jgi:hypothetical protein
VSGGVPVKRVMAASLLFAVFGRLVEALGAVRCDCTNDCRCQKPALAVFSWVFPLATPFPPCLTSHSRLTSAVRSPRSSSSTSLKVQTTPKFLPQTTGSDQVPHSPSREGIADEAAAEWLWTAVPGEPHL